MGPGQEKRAVLLRLKRIEGQIRGLQRMVDEDAACADILTQLAAVTAAIKKVGTAIVQAYMEECISKSREDRGMKREDALRDFQRAIARYIDWA